MMTKEFIGLVLVAVAIISIIVIVIHNIVIVKSSHKIPDGLDDGDCKEVIDYDDLRIIHKD